MDFRKVAGDIVLGLNDEKWQATETKIVDALDSAYRLGFLDGEASVAKRADKPKTRAVVAGRDVETGLHTVLEVEGIGI